MRVPVAAKFLRADVLLSKREIRASWDHKSRFIRPQVLISTPNFLVIWRLFVFSYWLMCSSCDWLSAARTPPSRRLCALSSSPLFSSLPTLTLTAQWCSLALLPEIHPTPRLRIPRSKKKKKKTLWPSQFRLLQHVAWPLWPWFSPAF